SGVQILDWMVGAAVAERELEGLEPDRSAQQLVAEADAEHPSAADPFANRVDDVAEGRRIARAVRQQDQVRIVLQDLLGRDGARQRGQPAVTLAELPDDGELDPGVDPDHVATAAVDLDWAL